MKNEVLILGAGSSRSYGFPTGDELLNIIINGEKYVGRDLIDSYEQAEVDERYSFNRYYKSCIDYYKKKYSFDDISFRKSLKLSGTKTIDTFLSNSKNHDDISFGKFAISSIISFYENLSQMQKFSNDNWIDYFFNQRISYQLETFLKNPPQIISFNYDTFLKNKLIKHLEKEHNFKNAAKFILDKDFITHVYGNLNSSSYPDYSFKEEEKVKDESLAVIKVVTNINYEKIESDSINIDFIRASATENAKINKIRRILKDADNIYILGYGFDKFNNQILFESENYFDNKEREIFYTSFGLEESLKEVLSNYVIQDGNIKDDQKCLPLLKKAMPHKLFPE